MAELDWKWIVIIGVLIIALSKLSPTPLMVGSQSVLNIEQGKTATVFISMTAPPPDVDTSDGNYTENYGEYRIITVNGTLVRDWTTTAIQTTYQAQIDYSPTDNSTIQARVVQKLYSYNTTTNISAYISETVLSTQDVDVVAVPSQTAPVVVTTTTTTGTHTIIPTTPSTPITIAPTITPTPEPTFWDQYGLLIIITISVLIFGFAIYSYMTNKGKRRR